MSHTQNHAPESQRPEYTDEISLVDLVATLIRRRRVLYVVFIVISLSGMAYALLAADEYEYVSLVQIAQKDSETFFQSPETTIATLENRWLPEVQAGYRAKHDEKLPFRVSFNNPEGTGLIRLSTAAPESASRAVGVAHSALINGVKEYQESLVKREKLSLERQIASLEGAVEALKGQPGTGEAIAGAIERQSKLEGRLKDLRGVEVLVTSRQGADKETPKRSLIIVVAALLGLMMGVFFAFISEFTVSVRDRIASDGLE